MAKNSAIVQLEHLSFSVESIAVHSSSSELEDYFVCGEIIYALDGVITITVDWNVTLLASNEGMSENGFLVKYSLVPDWSFSDANARTSSEISWPTREEWDDWLADSLSSESLLEDLRPHMPEPILS